MQHDHQRTIHAQDDPLYYTCVDYYGATTRDRKDCGTTVIPMVILVLVQAARGGWCLSINYGLSTSSRNTYCLRQVRVMHVWILEACDDFASVLLGYCVEGEDSIHEIAFSIER